jgi:N-formylglutamate deformylase
MEYLNQHLGTSPLLISVPHAGTLIPPEIKDRMQPETLFLPDTDWFVDRLYGWAPVEGASMISTAWSRYVIDLNRPPDNQPLYERPGSSLVPTSTFCGMELYREGDAPDEAEVQERLELYWQPYHERLAEMLDAIRARHGYAVLLDAHSIRSELPGLFEGELPHLNLGSNAGASAALSLVDDAWSLLSASVFEAVRDGRFKGGYITRHYGRPSQGVHAMQLEIAQRAYMPEFPPQWDRARSSKMVELLRRLVQLLQNWKPGGDTIVV